MRGEGRKNFEGWRGNGKVGPKTQKRWEQVGHCMEEIAPNRQPVGPAAMIHSILEAIYDDYLQSKYANHEQRRDDLLTLENFARTFQDSVEFLSQLSLMATGSSETIAAEEDDSEKVTLSPIHQAQALECPPALLL